MDTRLKMPDKANIQGLILRGYTHPYSCHLLFSFPESNADEISSFFKDLYPLVQSAVDWGRKKPQSMLNIGLTFNGITKLSKEILLPTDLGNFPLAFQNGPWSKSSQQSLQDTADPKSMPSQWWNKKGCKVNEELHCIVHTYALTESAMDSIVDLVTASATTNGLTEIIPLALTTGNGRLYQTMVDRNSAKIHFGYTDGLSEPDLKNTGSSSPFSTPADNSNFLIGYYNGSTSYPGPFDGTKAGSFAKDGCYNAFRVIYQDVACFNKLLKDLASKHGQDLAFLKLNALELEEWFAAKLCGRWRNGSPLILSPDKPDENEDTAATGEDFGYAVLNTLPGQPTGSVATDNQLSSYSCPFSAHTRVANPRNQNLVNAEGATGPPRIVRRGMPYGASLTSGNEDDGVDRGLIGMFLCGDFSTQFEKLYGWMNCNNFSDKQIFSIKHPPQDALLGNRALLKNNPIFPGVVTSFIIPVGDPNLKEKKQIVIPELPQFLTTRGTAYCLLPSLASLAKIAGMKAA